MKVWSKLLIVLVGVLLSGNVIAQQPAKKPTETIKIECEYSELNMGTHVFTCKTNVTVIDPPGTKIQCDYLKAQLTTNNNDFTIIYADDNVVITITDKDGEKVATGKNAVYDKATDIMTLTGEPTLKTAFGRAKGMEKVIYDRKKNILTALGGKQTAEFEPKKLPAKKPEGEADKSKQ